MSRALAEGKPTPVPQTGRVTAPGWRANPFGDVGIAHKANGTDVIYVAGLHKGGHGILRKEVSAGSAWETFMG